MSTAILLVSALSFAVANEDGSVSHTLTVATDGAVTTTRTFLSSRDIRAAGREAAKAQGHRLGLFAEVEPNVFTAESLDVPGATVRAERKGARVTILPLCTAGSDRAAAKAAAKAAAEAERKAKADAKSAEKAAKAAEKAAKAEAKAKEAADKAKAAAKAAKAATKGKAPGKAPGKAKAKPAAPVATDAKTGAEVEAPV